MSDTKLKVPYCTKCETPRDNEVFCHKCGTPVVEGARTCACGYDNIWPHENFCCKCGKPALSSTSDRTEIVHGSH